MEVLLIVLVIAGLIAAIYFSKLAEKRRREAMAALAAELGWQFDPSRDRDHDDEYAHFEVFRQGHSRAAYNTVYGSLEIDGRNYPVKMGDFTYEITTSTGETTITTTYRLSYLILHLPFGSVPDLLIRREGVFDALAGVFGLEDIDFESHEFSKRFYVKSPNKRFAYDVVHPRMMRFLLDADPPAIDIERGRCCFTDGKQRWEPWEFKSRLQWAGDFFRLWPEYLTAQIESS